MHDTTKLSAADLRQFSGTEHWYRHPIMRNVLYTDGVQYVAETGGAYWLLDEIAFTQKGDKRVAAEAFQLWKLIVNEDRSALLVCEDGDCKEVYRKRIEWTDFPLPEISFYFIDNVILLPSEY